MKPPLLRKEELQMVREALIVPVMLEYIQHDMNLIEKSSFKMDVVLVNSFVKMQSAVLTEHFYLKQELKMRGIKLLIENRTQKGIGASYMCRGYKHEINLLWEIVRTEILRKASQHTNTTLTSG